MVPVEGTCDARFASVREAFVTNFTERGDVGAASPVSVGGRQSSSMWGLGRRRAGGVAAQHAGQRLLVQPGPAPSAPALERGLVDTRRHHARGPAFAAAGKEGITCGRCSPIARAPAVRAAARTRCSIGRA
jgi:hypothetical protein